MAYLLLLTGRSPSSYVFLSCFCMSRENKARCHWYTCNNITILNKYVYLFNQKSQKKAHPIMVSKNPHKYFLKSPYIVFPKISLWASLLPLEYMYTCKKINKWLLQIFLYIHTWQCFRLWLICLGHCACESLWIQVLHAG